MIRFLLCLAVLPGAAPAAAQPVELTSTIAVERIATDVSGKQVARLEEPKVVTPGDRLRFTLTYVNQGTSPAKDFGITNPLPAAVAYAGDASAGALVSVDGGKTWGDLATLKISESGKLRPAAAADVTHVRWQFAAPIPAGKTGTVSFRGVVK